ncbi:hypothetical protein Tco_0035613 [Tanacetum coccineum]
MIQLPVSIRQWIFSHLQPLQGSLKPIINLELPLIQETKLLFKTSGLLCNKFKGGMDKVMLVIAIRVMLLVLGGNNAGGQARVVKCNNCQGKGHMARQWTQLKRPRNDARFKEKAMLAEAQEAGKILDEEQLAFLADPTGDLDAYDSDCDDVSNAKAVLMANLSNYGSDVISEVPHFEPYHTDMDNQSVHAKQGFEQTPVADFTDNEITSDSNIILYSQ